MMGTGLWHAQRVDTRDILAANVNALMTRNNDPAAHRKLVKAGIPNGTLGRIRNSEVGTSVDNLEKLAAGLDVPAWLLLVPPETRDAVHALWQAASLLKPSAPSAAPVQAPASVSPRRKWA